jgi:phosphoribosylformylglycinamidine cyclo-ligase
MMRVFNNGIGMILVVNKDEVEEIIERIKAMEEIAYHIGWIETREEGENPVQFIE